MKTKFTLLLALALSAESATAASPNLPAMKAPVLRNLPSRPIIQRSAPAIIPGKGRVIPNGNRSLSAKPQVEIRKVIPGLNLPNAAALRKGREIVEGLKAFDSLRNSGFQNLMPEGLSGHGSGRPAGPSDPFANHGTGMREPKAPGEVSGRRSGLTDIRGSAGRGSRGYQGDGQQERGGASPNDVSRRGESIFSAGRESRFGGGSGFTGSASEPSYERNEENGDIIMSMDFTNPDGTHGRYSVTEHHNNDGSVSGTTERIAVEKPNGSVTSTEVKRDATGGVVAQGRVVLNPDGSGGESGTASGSPGPVEKPNQKIDRSNGDISMGGPVNGSGPSVGQAAGLMPLDLLRQTAEGEQSRGGANYMTSGRLTSDQVNRGGRDGNHPDTRTSDPRGQAIRNGIGSGVAGPTTSGSGGGLPD